MKKTIIFLIFFIIFSNIVFAQSEVERLRQEIKSKIVEIRNEFNKVISLIDDRDGILRGCIYREDDQTNEACYGDNFDDLLGYLDESINNLDNMTSSTARNFNNIEEFWENINSGFPLLYIPNWYTVGWSYRHTYTIGMGVNEGTPWWSFGLSIKKIARDVIRIHVLNANDGPAGTNYDDFFDNGKFKEKDYYIRRYYTGGGKLVVYLENALKEGNDVKTSLGAYLDYLKNNGILNKISTLTENFEKVIQEYNGRIEGGVRLCLTTLAEVENKVMNENSTTTLNNILNNLNQFATSMKSNTIGNDIGEEETIPELLATIYKQGFLITLDKTNLKKDLGDGNMRGYQHIFPKNLDDEVKFWENLYSKSLKLFTSFFDYCVGNTLVIGQTPGGRTIKNLTQDFEKNVQDFNRSFSFTWSELEVATTQISLAVIPPVVWSDKHQGVESLKQITPERIFDEIKNFLFSLAPIMFILLLVVGAIFYIVSPIKIEYIKTGSEYIKWAVIGYFLLLAISAIFSALKVIFGAP